MQDDKILVWLPSPMGDAILCTPALRSIRKHFNSAKITFLGSSVVRQVLSPNELCDSWLETGGGLTARVKMLRKENFRQAILFKNSFGSALTVFLAGVPSRIGYSREGRGVLLTEKLYPAKLPTGGFKPESMVDYYLAIASWLGGAIEERATELLTDGHDDKGLSYKLPELAAAKGPIVIIVPGGAFGPSKCWPSERFARTADEMIEKYNATVVISVSPAEAEKTIAKEIQEESGNDLIDLSQRGVSLGELKALFSRADLVISNDTGPRHIAIALGKKIVTLFGPNNYLWTETGYEDEIKIISDVHCAPCDKGTCEKPEHICMEWITVEMVCRAAEKLLAKDETV
jgi:heptosyltransferase-2